MHRTGATATTTDKSLKKSFMRTSDQAKQTGFSELSTEVKHFRKLVAQVEDLVEERTSSPQQQHRSHILVLSAQEANRDISEKLDLYEQSLGDQATRACQAGCMKLHRDYSRAHKALNAALLEHQNRQHSDVSTLLQVGTGSNSGRLLQQEQEEDYFERVTREREEDIKKINLKMHQMNAIYNDLAAIIVDQQTQIDSVEENVYETKSRADLGFKHIEYARDRLCVMGDAGVEVPRCGGDVDDVVDEDHRYGTKQKEKDKYERLPSWYKPIHSLQEDIFGLGNDLASLGCSISENLECGKGRSSVYDDSGSVAARS